jgi:predicted O-methyltransferase YrrM
MDVEQLLASAPPMHPDESGIPVAMEAPAEVLRLIDRTVGEGSRTLETGGGLSTLLFAMKGARHDCVVPFAAEIARIRSRCEQLGISHERVTFHQSPSEKLLPGLDPEPLDLVLIDGGHGFPSPFIDWYYAGRRLRLGGTLIVDDTQLWTGRVLKEYLEEQPGWELVENLPLRSAAFRRTGDEQELQDWIHQPYVARRSGTSTLSRFARRSAKAVDLARREGIRSVVERARSRS